MDFNPKVLAELQLYQWAMDPEHLSVMYGATTADLGAKMAGPSKAYVNGNVGVIDVSGPIAPRRSFLADLFGLTSVEQISADIRTLEANEGVTDIVFLTDSPGGAVTGMSDLSEQIKTTNKRTTAFVAGTMASAAYWFGSAADNIVARETALVGSIGVVATVTPWAKAGEVTVVSSQSPKKRQDPTTEDGLATLQSMVDDLAAIFMGNVAANRGVDLETVSEKYGKGGTFLAAEALDRGMIDGISSFQGLIDTLMTAAGGEEKREGKNMDLKALQKDFPEVFEAAVNIGVDIERKRAEAHLIMGEASGDMPTAMDAVRTGAEMDALFTAKYQAAGMKAAQLAARSADNPTDVNGDVDIKPTKTEEELVAEAVCQGLSYYAEEGVVE